MDEDVELAGEYDLAGGVPLPASPVLRLRGESGVAGFSKMFDYMA